MSYREFAPPAALRDALACVWIRNVAADDPGPVHVMPDGCMDLVWRAGHRTILAGPDTGSRPVRVAPGELLIGVRFLPGAGGPALGLALSEVRDLQINAAELWPELDRRLDPELRPRDAVDRLVAAAGSFVAVRRPDAIVRRAAALLADPRINLEALSGELGLGERQLRRRFHVAVGYGPKTLQRVLRFRRFLEQLDRGSDLASIAAETGYADQAHLTRESTRLAGMTPAALAASRARPL